MNQFFLLEIWCHEHHEAWSPADTLRKYPLDVGGTWVKWTVCFIKYTSDLNMDAVVSFCTEISTHPKFLSFLIIFSGSCAGILFCSFCKPTIFLSTLRKYFNTNGYTYEYIDQSSSLCDTIKQSHTISTTDFICNHLLCILLNLLNYIQMCLLVNKLSNL